MEQEYRKTFSVCEGNNDFVCIAEGYSRDEAIQSAREHLETKSVENDEYGEFSERFTLTITAEDSELEKIESIEIEWETQRDTYDGGRFDYGVAIGSVRSF